MSLQNSGDYPGPFVTREVAMAGQARRSMYRSVVWLVSFLAAAQAVLAGAHTWDVNEVFMNADGTIWFIELREANGTPGETGLAGRPVTSLATGKSLTICCGVAAPTTNKHYLIANAAFAALPGAPTPNHIETNAANVNSFFSVAGDRVSYSPYDQWTFGAVPTDGINSMNRTGAPLIRANSPTNYAGVTGSVDASGGGPPPAVPDGTGGSSPVVAERLAVDSVLVSWDTASCEDNPEHVVIWGGGADLPDSPGQPFAVSGAVCDLGPASSFTWNPTPVISDGTGLLWWLVVVQDDGGTEGSWGTGSSGERVGPGPGGTSGQCEAAVRDLTNTCGH
jgi:hypothetical protein